MAAVALWPASPDGLCCHLSFPPGRTGVVAASPLTTFWILGLSLWTDMSPHKDALDILQMFSISLYLVEVYHLP